MAKCRTKSSFSMVFLEKWGLTEVIKKLKSAKIRGYVASIMILCRCRGGFMVGVCFD